MAEQATTRLEVSVGTGQSVQNVNALSQAIDKLVGTTEKLAVVDKKTTETQRASTTEVQRFFSANDKRIEAAARYQNRLEQVARWEQRGIGTEQERAAAIALATRNYESAMRGLQAYGQHMDKAATATGLARHEVINLGRQLQDVAVSIGGGQSIGRVLLEQGTQILDIFVSMTGTIRGFFTQMGTWAARALLSFTGIGGAIAAIAGGLGAAAAMFSSTQREMERALLGVGTAAGVTAGQIQKIAESASGFGRSSVSEARDFAMALAQAGTLGAESIGNLTDVSKEFAQVLGTDVAQAGKTLGNIFTDPSRAMKELGQVMGTFDQGIAKTVQNLAQQGNAFGAAQVAAKALTDRLKEMQPEIDRTIGFWTKFGNAVSHFWEKVKEASARGFGLTVSLEEDLANAQAALKQAERTFVAGGPLGEAYKAKLRADVAEIEKILEGMRQRREDILRSRTVEGIGGILGDVTPDIEKIKKIENQIRGLDAALQQIEIDPKFAAELERAGFKPEQFQAGINALILMRQLTKETAEESARHNKEIRLLALQYQGVSIEVAKMLDSLRAQTAIAQATPGPQRTGVEDREREIVLLREGKSIEAARLLVTAERKQKQAEVSSQIEQQNHQLKQQAELTMANLTGMGDQVRVAQARVNAERAGADAAGQRAAAEGQAKANAEARAAQDLVSLRNYESQLASIQARTAAERQSAAYLQAYNQALNSGSSLWQAQVAGARAVNLEIAKMAASYRDQMIALQEQIRVNSAITGTEKMRAQEIARTNQLLREGYSQSQASDIAAMERLATQKQINASVEAQTRAIYEQIQYLRDVSQYGRDAADAAAAYRDAIRQGADATVAAARAAATLELAMEKVQLAAEEAANSTAQIGLNAAKSAAAAGNLAAKLDLIGTGQRPGSSFSLGQATSIISSPMGYTGGPLVGAAGMSTPYNVSYSSEAPVFGVPLGTGGVDYNIRLQNEIMKRQEELQQKNLEAIQLLAKQQTPGTDEYIQAQQAAAQAAEDAARAQEAAAEAARQAAEELRKQGNEAFQNFAASYLIKGMAPLAVNAMIESGAIPRFDPSTTFQTQLDLYKRAGVSAERTRADILAGIIGEGVAPTELLAALDSLTEAVGANTAAQLGLSDFYTQQGDRLLGYRGYNVQTGIPRGTGSGTVIGGTGTGTGTGAEPYGGVPNTYPAGTPVYDPNTGIITTTSGIGTTTGTGGGVLMQRILNGYIVEGYYSANGQWTTTRTIMIAPGITKPADTYGTPVGQTPTPVPLGSPVNYTDPYMQQPATTPTMLNLLYGQPMKYFAEGGVALSPTYGIFGERGPEAFVPLRGGAIPVKLMMPPGMQTAAGAAVERTVINILAPLINFMAEPTRDEVRESAFQAAQQLRRMMAAA